MKKIVASVTVAMVLGVIVMLIPVMAYTQFFVATKDSQELLGGENDLARAPLATQEGNNSKSASYGPPDKEGKTPGQEDHDFEVTSLETLDEAAQAYGRMDAGPSPFPSSLFHATLVVAIGLAAALGISLYFKRKAGHI